MSEDCRYCRLCERYLQDHPEISEKHRGQALERLLELRRPSPSYDWSEMEQKRLNWHATEAGWQLHQAAALEAGEQLSGVGGATSLRDVLEAEASLGKRAARAALGFDARVKLGTGRLTRPDGR